MLVEVRRHGDELKADRYLPLPIREADRPGGVGRLMRQGSKLSGARKAQKSSGQIAAIAPTRRSSAERHGETHRSRRQTAATIPSRQRTSALDRMLWTASAPPAPSTSRRWAFRRSATCSNIFPRTYQFESSEKPIAQLVERPDPDRPRRRSSRSITSRHARGRDLKRRFDDGAGRLSLRGFTAAISARGFIPACTSACRGR